MNAKKTFYMIKKFLSRLLVTVLLCSAGAAIAEAQTIHAITIQDALDLAKKNNIQVKTALTNLALQEQTNKQVTADALPQISATGTSTNYFQIPVIVLAANSFGTRSSCKSAGRILKPEIQSRSRNQPDPETF